MLSCICNTSQKVFQQRANSRAVYCKNPMYAMKMHFAWLEISCAYIKWK